MIRKRFIIGLVFGVFILIFMFILLYASGDELRNHFTELYLQRALIAGIISGAIYGILFGRLPKQKID